MLIIAGTLHVDPSDRDRYLAADMGAVVAARAATGCLDFVLSADPVDPGRINVFERWESETELLAFRGAGESSADAPPLLSADVRRYVISSIEDP